MLIIITLVLDFVLKMITVKFYGPDATAAREFIYSVVTAWFNGGWVFVRHHERNTFEIPGGHIEPGETPFEAAERELKEETGALKFNLYYVSTYSVTIDDETRYGQLFFAEIYEMGKVPDISEIEEITFLENLPDPVTYPEIQPHLFKKVLEYLKIIP